MYNRFSSRLYCLFSGLAIAAKHVRWEDEMRAAGLVGFMVKDGTGSGPSASEQFAQGMD